MFDSSFVRKELDKYDRNQVRGRRAGSEGYDFYDITAWSLPLTLGLDAWWTEDTPSIAGDTVTVDGKLPEVAAAGPGPVGIRVQRRGAGRNQPRLPAAR